LGANFARLASVFTVEVENFETQLVDQFHVVRRALALESPVKGRWCSIMA
jgi:hypothetical protein